MPAVDKMLLLGERTGSAVSASELQLGVAARRSLEVDAAVVGNVAANKEGGSRTHSHGFTISDE